VCSPRFETEASRTNLRGAPRLAEITNAGSAVQRMRLWNGPLCAIVQHIRQSARVPRYQEQRAGSRGTEEGKSLMDCTRWTPREGELSFLGCHSAPITCRRCIIPCNRPNTRAVRRGHAPVGPIPAECGTRCNEPRRQYPRSRGPADKHQGIAPVLERARALKPCHRASEPAELPSWASYCLATTSLRSISSGPGP